MAAIAFNWLEFPSARWTPSAGERSDAHHQVYTDFDCTAVTSLEKSAEGILDMAEKADEMMLRDFDGKQQLAEPRAATARSRALKVFNAIPSIVEKRSRQLVPHFLCWAMDEDDVLNTEADEDTPQDQGSTWSLVDRKGILGVFSKFINPRVLYQHERVYEALLQLMENGDVEVQKLALKAILAWKQEGVKAYQENLEYLLDEARFKNELAVFLPRRGQHQA